MRPTSIVWFERLYGMAVVLGVIAAIAFVGQVKARLAAGGVGLIGGYGAVVVGTAIPLLLLWLVARRASDPARWVLVALTALTLAGMLLSLARGTYLFNLFGWLGLAQRALTVAAVALTFRADAQAWLVRPRREA